MTAQVVTALGANEFHARGFAPRWGRAWPISSFEWPPEPAGQFYIYIYIYIHIYIYMCVCTAEDANSTPSGR